MGEGDNGEGHGGLIPGALVAVPCVEDVLALALPFVGVVVACVARPTAPGVLSWGRKGLCMATSQPCSRTPCMAAAPWSSTSSCNSSASIRPFPRLCRPFAQWALVAGQPPVLGVPHMPCCPHTTSCPPHALFATAPLPCLRFSL